MKSNPSINLLLEVNSSFFKTNYQHSVACCKTHSLDQLWLFMLHQFSTGNTFFDTREPKVSSTLLQKKMGIHVMQWLRLCFSITMALDLIPWSYSYMRKFVGTSIDSQTNPICKYNTVRTQYAQNEITQNHSQFIDRACNSISPSVQLAK